MSGTKIDSCQDALLTAIQARTNLAALQARKAITLGYPPGGPQPEAIWIRGDVAGWELGGPEFDEDPQQPETFQLQVAVAVIRASRDFTPLRDRAMVLMREVAAAIAADRRLGGAAVDTMLVGGSMEEAVLEEGKRQAGALLLVRIRTFTD